MASDITALQSANQVFDADYAEVIQGMRLFAEVAATADTIGDLQVIILWRVKGPMLGELRAAMRAELNAYSSNVVSRMVEDADHSSSLGTEKYARQVSDAILEVLRRYRQRWVFSKQSTT